MIYLEKVFSGAAVLAIRYGASVVDRRAFKGTVKGDGLALKSQCQKYAARVITQAENVFFELLLNSVLKGARKHFKPRK